MEEQSLLYLLPLLLAGLIATSLIFFGWKKRSFPGAVSLIWLAAGVAIWSLGYLLELRVDNLAAMIFWGKFQYVGIVLVPLSWFCLVLDYTGRAHLLTRPRLAVLALIPAITLAALLFQETLVWRTVAAAPAGPFLILDPTYGPVFWLHWAFGNLLLFFSSLLLVRYALTALQVYRWQALALFGSALLPWLGNTLYVTGLLTIDLTVFAFTVSTLILTWAILRVQLFDILPVAREHVIDSISDGMIVLDWQNRIVDLNPAAAEMIGRPATAILGGAIEELFADYRHLLDHFRDVTRAHEDFVVEVGEEQRIYNLRLSPLLDRQQQYQGALAIFRDVTTQRKVEAQRLEQETYLRILFEQTPAGILTVDMNGVVTNANPRCLEILGSPNISATIGLNVLQLPTLVQPGISALLAQALATGEMVEKETWYTSLWHKTVYLFFRAVPHFNAVGEQIGLIILVEDLTRRMRAEEGMRQAQKLESLGVLAGGIAHDFNNLLVAMMGQTSLAQAKLAPDNPARPHIDKAVLATEQAARLTQQLLAYSGRSKFQVEPFALNTLIEENLHLFAATIPKNIQLRTDLAPELLYVEGDVTQLQQVVMNIILNAAEAIGADNGMITIHTTRQEVTAADRQFWQYTSMPLAPGRYVALVVQDDGPGIPATDLPNIFDPFFTTKDKGHGLGLAAVLGIVRSHQGGLTVETAPGRGTTFTLLLPASAKPEPARPVEYVEKNGHHQGMVLIIDDEVYVREAAQEILALDDIQAMTAADGRTGLDLYRRHQFQVSLVLLDLSMPGWSGERTMQELRQVNPEVRILLTSGYNEAEATRHFQSNTLTGFLQKPYHAYDLIKTVRAHLS